MLRAGERLVFPEGHFRAEKEIGKRAFVKDAVDDDSAVLHLEVEAVVLGPVAVEDVAISLDPSEPVILNPVEILLGDAEFL